MFFVVKPKENKTWLIDWLTEISNDTLNVKKPNLICLKSSDEVMNLPLEVSLGLDHTQWVSMAWGVWICFVLYFLSVCGWHFLWICIVVASIRETVSYMCTCQKLVLRSYVPKSARTPHLVHTRRVIYCSRSDSDRCQWSLLVCWHFRWCHELHETCLWCELTSTMNATERQVSWNSCFLPWSAGGSVCSTHELQ